MENKEKAVELAKNFAKAVQQSISKSLMGEELTEENRAKTLKSMGDSVVQILNERFDGFGEDVDVIASAGADLGQVNISLIAKTDYGREIVREMERCTAETAITSHHDVAEVIPLPTGYNLYVVKEPAGPVYLTDEVVGGALLWNPAQVDESTINTMLQHYYNPKFNRDE